MHTPISTKVGRLFFTGLIILQMLSTRYYSEEVEISSIDSVSDSRLARGRVHLHRLLSRGTKSQSTLLGVTRAQALKIR